MRATMSMPPPAAKPTRMRTGFVGYAGAAVCPNAVAERDNAAAHATGIEGFIVSPSVVYRLRVVRGVHADVNDVRPVHRECAYQRALEIRGVFARHHRNAEIMRGRLSGFGEERGAVVRQ